MTDAHTVTVEILEKLAISEAQELAEYIRTHPTNLDGIMTRLDELRFDITRWQVETSVF